MSVVLFFFFKQKTAYEMRISDWSSDVCSSDLLGIVEGRAIVGRHAHAARRLGDRDAAVREVAVLEQRAQRLPRRATEILEADHLHRGAQGRIGREPIGKVGVQARPVESLAAHLVAALRSEEHTSELQTLMRISSAVFCLDTKQT